MLLLALYCTYCAPTPFLYTLHSSQVIVDRPTQLICISDIYLLSWRWWPLWSIGTLYQWSLRLKKASWVRFFSKISVLYTNYRWKSKKQDKKRAKNLQKRWFFQPFQPAGWVWTDFDICQKPFERIFWKEIGPSLLFLAAGTIDTKFRCSTGVTTANSTNKYQKYKSVELGDQLK